MGRDDDLLPDWLTTKEAAELSGFSATELRNMRDRNEIHTTIKGRTVLYQKDEMITLRNRPKKTWKRKIEGKDG